MAVNLGSGLALAAVAVAFTAGFADAAGLAATFAAAFTAGLTGAADFLAGTGFAGACFFNGFACFLVAILVGTRVFRQKGPYIEAGESPF
ncbi:MAG TPA: hypothetical protein VNU97_17155 [Rhizomicrobium sp.]|nr:hypothetical protein [Rhizomicrobium sp.]